MAAIADKVDEVFIDDLIAERDFFKMYLELRYDNQNYNAGDKKIMGALADCLMKIAIGAPWAQPSYVLDERDYIPAANLYNLAPAHYKELWEPYLTEWKEKIFSKKD